MANRSISVADNVARKLKEIVDKMGGGTLKVGFLEGATYPDGTPVASVAFWNEFGTTSSSQGIESGEVSTVERQPPRPFFRTMIAEKSPAWPAQMGQLAKSTGYDGPRVLALMGEQIEGDLKESINNFSDPPLAPSTIKAKGFDKPLIAIRTRTSTCDLSGYGVNRDLEFSASRWAARLGVALDFDAQKGWLARHRQRALRGFYNFNRMHGFGLHPVNAPGSWMCGRFFCGTIANCAVAAVITNMRRATPGVPIKKEAGPMMMMHRFSCARLGDADLQHAHEFIFEDHLVTVGSDLHGVETIGEPGFVLPVQVKTAAKQRH